jgi:hypothetical protein
LEHVIDRIIG